MRVMSDLCKRGHELAGDNLLIQHGRRVCRTCDRATLCPDVAATGKHRQAS